MGLVFRVRHRLLDRVVAIKILLDGRDASPELRLRFRIEAEAVARLQHPGIVRVFEFGEVEGWPFLVIEYLPGGSLDDLLSAGRRLAPAAAASLVAARADAAAAAHRAGVTHRDLKPANILLAAPRGSEAGAAPRVKVADFGLAKLDQFDVTRHGVLVGTPARSARRRTFGRSGSCCTNCSPAAGRSPRRTPPRR